MQIIRIASRKSKLAIRQTQIVIDLIKEKYTDVEFQIIKVETLGDKNLEDKLSKIGTKGLFTFEIENMLLNGSVDMAVHSLKDMPTDFIQDLEIGAYIKRKSHEDIIIFNKDYKKLSDLPNNAKIGTSSLRREAQIRRINQKFNICNIRGNIHTRLKKMVDEDFDAIILAKAGLERLGMLCSVSYQDLPFISAVGQGCICVEVKKNNQKIKEMLEFLNDEETMACVKSERDFLKTMGGGCHIPMGAYCEKVRDKYKISAFVSSDDGKKYISDEIVSETTDNIGNILAKKLISKGADKLLKSM